MRTRTSRVAFCFSNDHCGDSSYSLETSKEPQGKRAIPRKKEHETTHRVPDNEVMLHFLYAEHYKPVGTNVRKSCLYVVRRYCRIGCSTSSVFHRPSLSASKAYRGAADHLPGGQVIKGAGWRVRGGWCGVDGGAGWLGGPVTEWSSWPSHCIQRQWY